MDEPTFVYEFDLLLEGFQLDTVNTDAIGSDVTKITSLLKEAFEEEKKFLRMAAQCKKPAQDKLTALAQDLTKKVQEIASIEAKSKQVKALNHLKSVASISPALMWVVAPNRPAQYVKDMIDSAEYYTNRILKDHKDEADPHRAFAVKLVALFKALQAYVKDFHNMGVTWNPKGGEAASVGSAPPAGAPPSGPPPASASSGGDSSGGGAAAALFQSINKGGAITAGLKKVDDSMKTHKNPQLRASNVVKDSALPKKTAPAAQKPAATPANKPPVFKCANKKWAVEYQNGATLEINEGGLAYTIYMYKCQKVSLRVTPKMNSVILDSCEKCEVILDSGIISSFEMIKSKGCHVKCMDVVPTITLDGCDSCHVFLSDKSLDSEILTAKSSTSNVTLMNPGGEDVELYVPELFRNKVKGNKIVTEAVVHE